MKISELDLTYRMSCLHPDVAGKWLASDAHERAIVAGVHLDRTNDWQDYQSNCLHIEGNDVYPIEGLPGCATCTTKYMSCHSSHMLNLFSLPVSSHRCAFLSTCEISSLCIFLIRA